VGKSGAVFEAVDRRTGVSVAIKRAHRRGAPFATETSVALQSSAANAHGAVVRIFDRGEDSFGRGFLVMEHLRGKSLAQRLGEVPLLTTSEGMRLALQMSRAGAAVHARGIVHAFLKPGHVFLCGQTGAVRLLDFRARTGNEGRFSEAHWYAAPELTVPGRDISAKADTYSLGCILFQMLCGRPPFAGSPLLAAMAHRRVVPVFAPQCEVPARLRQLVLAMLRKRPDARPDMGQVVQVLSRLV